MIIGDGDMVSENYINRELSWLEFNDRVLKEAKDKNNPLFERLKFLSIVSSNLDEFFMVRVASLKDQVHAGYHKKDPSGLTPKEQLRDISIRTHKLVAEAYNTYSRSLIPKLRKKGILLLDKRSLTLEDGDYLKNYYYKYIYPVLTPMAVDSSRPFPLILNKSLNIGVLVKDSDQLLFATVQVPSVLDRIIEIPSKGEGKKFILLEEVITLFIKELFIGKRIIFAYPYRITRNTDLPIEEEEAEDLLIEIEKSLKKRKWGEAVRLEIDGAADELLIDILKNALEIHDKDIYRIRGPIDLTFMEHFYSLEGYEGLKYKPFKPQLIDALLSTNKSIFERIKEGDIFLHLPYDSFQPVVEFVKEASKDPDVLAIKQTLYRVSGDSPIVKALVEAAERGKQVTVVVELRARFDEEVNIQWAKKMEKAGCHVLYGFKNLKTHAKITLVVRREKEGICRYVHLSTGNYNDITARLYTDVGIFTAKREYGVDASKIFNFLSGFSEVPHLKKLNMAPYDLRQKLYEMIAREISFAEKGLKAKVIIKVNSLVDEEMIDKLYQASTAGVEIELIVRGICCLRPGIENLSGNIRVRSIVGRFLEHSRIFYFYNNGKEEVYFSSADLMPRNLNRRIELLFPVDSSIIKEKIIGILDIELRDTMKARLLNSDGSYKRVDKRGKEKMDSQQHFMNLAIAQGKAMCRFQNNLPLEECILYLRDVKED
ncbi:RNA degradosome polyphosphate kinase [Alkaliphilus serpentinus]|uniref:Polyphosphate kinase n=1 Tax=Alkaliphilus serpentinus TaxID=1482731 RepID=A0A833HQH6_9FIRM|nr:RNA degradosome polyphosphate kinase [Alkaliphilus serpentinus]KAB3531785.1 RNA degradosome polyphosphate kinase [Alkaliphilus serpentinus]